MRLNLFLLILMLFADLTFGKILKRKRIVQHGDLMIGALVPVHEQPSFKDNEDLPHGQRRKCGVIRDQYGVQRVEALLYILDKINNKNITNLLPNIKLGLEIRDECWETSIALEETINFIKDTIASDSENEEDDENLIESNTNETNILNGSDNNSSSLIFQQTEKCLTTNQNQNQNRILAVIGPGGSSVAINVQNLLQLFDIPQISYSATSRDLSDKKMFKTFLRVVPSDYLQVRAMTDLVAKMNWTFIFAIYTDGSYGQAGMEAFRNETSYLNICLALYEKIREYASDEDYEIVIKKMNQTAKARVIVCFCYGETIRGLLGAIHRLNLKGRFIIVGSDGWSDRIDVAKDYYEEAVGSISFKAYSPLVHEFDDFFTNLNPSNNLRNVWFNEYWEERFKCYIDEASISKFKTPCKRKCPTNFVSIGKHCYWFSTEDRIWHDAQLECKDKYFHADLLDLNNKDELSEVFEYLASNAMTDHLRKIHVRIKILQDYNEQPSESEEKRFQFDENNSAENTIKLKMCKPIVKLEKPADYDSKQPFLLSSSSSAAQMFSDFEASLSNEEVITFFNSKIQQSRPQCISIAITNNFVLNMQKNNFTYCIELKECNKNLPFICKYETNKTRSNMTKKATDVYPDTLRGYQQDPKMSYVMNSFLAVVHGLDKAHKKYCNGSGLCERMKKINGTELLKNIKESNFLGITNEKIYFDPNGDPPGRYVVLNVQKHLNKEENTTSYVYKEVGRWDNIFKLNLHLDEIKFPEENFVFPSVCSETCGFGHVKQIKQGGLKCCWNCKRCDNHSYVLDEFACQECEPGYWPNKNLTGCEKLPLTYLKWNDAGAIFALLISSIGITINTFVTHIFIKFSHTCVVKSTTKELSFIILAGVYLSYLMTIPLILRPSMVTCYLSRIMPGFSLSLIYGALITKTNRIARILARSKKRILTKKPRFMSLTAQILITCVIIAIECALIIAGFVLEPGVSVVTYPQRNRARLQCYNSILTVFGPLGYNILLVVLCTWYAIRTRNLPENFNEAKFIGFSMYTTCVIWMAFISLYFGSDFKVITLCLSTSFSATVILAFLFVPKVYIIIFKPEKNQRSAFATSKDLRIHFGSSLPANKEYSSENDKSSSLNKKQNGLSLFERIMLKPDAQRISVKSSSNSTSLKPDNNNTTNNNINNLNQNTINKPTTTSFNYIRYAHRPRLLQDKSVESFETYSSVYQINDRSCQTSLELLDPIVDNVLKRRKITETTSLKDEKELDINNNNNNNKKTNEEKKSSVSLTNFLFFPQNENFDASSKNLLEKTNVNDEDEDKSIDLSSNSFTTTTATSERKNHSTSGFFRRSLKILNKTTNLLRGGGGNESKEETNSTADTKNNDNSKRFRFSKNKPKLNFIIENEDSIVLEDDEEKVELQRFYEKKKVDMINEENNSCSTLKDSENASECENEFTNKMIKEDESLENFKKIFIQNKNMVVNWDYVQSSDYL